MKYLCLIYTDSGAVKSLSQNELDGDNCFVIDARDLNEAIQVASQMPMARTGCVEVRPVREQPKAG
jgi:hypothetical protein